MQKKVFRVPFFVEAVLQRAASYYAYYFYSCIFLNANPYRLGSTVFELGILFQREQVKGISRLQGASPAARRLRRP